MEILIIAIVIVPILICYALLVPKSEWRAIKRDLLRTFTCRPLKRD